MGDKYIGKQIGIYQITELMPYKHADRHAIYKGVCIKCGFIRFGKINDLKRTVDCKHINTDVRHTAKNKWNNDRVGRIFNAMKQRCYNNRNKDYRWYGAKGIKICSEWLENPSLFEYWAMQNGYQDDLTIDRINENKDYCPENCQWIPNVTNAKYKSTTSYICANGVTHSGKDWSNILGFEAGLINKYVRKYGLENTEIFIEKYLNNPYFGPRHGKSYYDLYMS